MSPPSRRPARVWRLLLLALVLAVVLLVLLERLGAIEVRSRLGHLATLPIFGTGLSRKQAAKVARLRVGIVRGAEGEMRAVQAVLHKLGVTPEVYDAGKLPDADVLVLPSCSSSDPDTVSAWLNAPVTTETGGHAKRDARETPRPRRRAVCLAHDTGFQHLTPLAATGRLDVLALGERAALRRQVHVWGSVWEGVARGVESFVPIFPPPSLPPKVPREGVHRAALVDAGAEGHLQSLLADLEAAILANPPLWGYTLITAGTNGTLQRLVPLGTPDADNPNPQRVPDYTDASEGFTLHVFGDAAIPPLLDDEGWAVVRAQNGSLDDVITAVRGLDIVVPPAEDKNVTSAVPIALLAETPLLMSSHHLETHGYLAHYPPSYVLVPSALGAIPALAALRRGADPWAEHADDPGFGAPRDGGVESYSEFRAMLERENERAWGKVLLRAT